ncbi:hypothetical protein Tco_1011323, partial [Tanacetum coccineum]
FPKEDLEEKLKRWVRKEFKTFNEEAQLSIQHWKDSWHKISKEEKRVMYLDEIIKFYDATLERVLKELKIKIIKYEPYKKPLMLGELDLDILKAYER